MNKIKQSIENIDKWNSSRHQFSFCWTNEKKCLLTVLCVYWCKIVRTCLTVFVLFLTDWVISIWKLFIIIIIMYRQILMCTQWWWNEIKWHRKFSKKQQFRRCDWNFTILLVWLWLFDVMLHEFFFDSAWLLPLFVILLQIIKMKDFRFLAIKCIPYTLRLEIVCLKHRYSTN